MTTEIIDTTALQDLLQTNESQLLDVRLADDFAASHLPGAANNCVFEVAFAARLAECAPDKTSPVIVYGTATDSHESRHAADKLERLGYERILDYRDGLAGWQTAGNQVESGPPLPPPPPAPHGRIEVDLSESRLEWTGRNILSKHFGTVALKSGHLEFNQGELVGGEFVIDMEKMLCDDLAGDDMHDVLIAHLESDDFFDVGNHPEARYRIHSSEPINNGNASSPNLRLHGELMLRGESNPLAIDATTGLTPEGLPAAQATLALDRTAWGSIYGSARFFRRLGMHLVNELVDLQLRIVGS